MENQSVGVFKLASGREASLANLRLSRTYSGVREGSLETASSHIRFGICEQYRERNEPFIILDSDEGFLPNFQWQAEFVSNSGVKSTDAEYNSYLHICWFSEELSNNLHETIEKVLAQLV